MPSRPRSGCARGCRSSGWATTWWPAPTSVGPSRVLLAGHLDTVPPVGRQRGAAARGRARCTALGAVDMKGGLAVFLHLAGTSPSRRGPHLVLLCLRGGRPGSTAGSAALGASDPTCWRPTPPSWVSRPAASSRRDARGRCGSGSTLLGLRAHTARPHTGRNAIHRLAPLLTAVAGYEVRRPVLDGCEYAEQLQVVDGRRAGWPATWCRIEASLVVNHRFAPDRTGAQAESAIRELLGAVPRAGGPLGAVEVGTPARALRPGPPRPRRPGGGQRGSAPGQVGWTDVASFWASRGPGGQLRPGRPAAGPHAGRAREHRASSTMPAGVLDGRADSVGMPSTVGQALGPEGTASVAGGRVGP